MKLRSDYTALPQTQQGVGLLEVLIALLLLGIAALGYAALQGQSLQSTDEALTRTQSITILRGVAEKMRVNALGVTYVLKMTTPPPPAAPLPPTEAEILALYNAHMLVSFDPDAPDLPALPFIPCDVTSGCTPAETAQNDVREAKILAGTYGIDLGSSVCPGTAAGASTTCLIASWNGTSPEMGSSDTACMLATGAYRLGADCVYMEAY